MKGKVKIWGLTLLAIMLVISLAACGSKEKTPETSSTPGATTGTGGTETAVYEENGLPKDEKVTLKFAYWENGNGREWVDYALKTFQEKFPNVKIDTTYSPKIDTIIGTKLAANNDEDMFDVFSTYLGASAALGISLAQEGKIISQEDLWDRKLYDGDGKTLRELTTGLDKATPTLIGKQYGLPYGQSVTGLFYNKSLFEKNGWNENPKTWAEFNTLVDTIKAANVIPITFPGKYPGYLQFSMGTNQMYATADISGNLEKFNDDYKQYKTPFYMSPESINVHNKIFELGKKKAFPDGVAALSHTQSQMQLLQGQAAMASTGEWVQNEMKDSIPADFKWGFMLIPIGDNPDDVKYYSSHPGAGHYIWAAKPELNKKWAQEFLLWMYNLDVQQKFAETAGSLPVRADFMNDEAMVAKLQEAPKAVLEYMKNNKVKGASPGLRDVTLTDPNADKALKFMEEALIDISAGKQDPLPKLEEAEKMLQKAVDAQK
ncbi:extracellular solute-binding protein [Paenibacillus eucommiae]|uniref:N-acetylglucosamine transport system substrate-binding protein n=1 Tax=Paenibacillus eucommiae TaxID=1355755 RepID=A0ABS4J1W3_9BACL|nr:extracellular solute-binding protein [Paenibacillus eucommiae]MBP1993816.1 N-acetylglucosamine transport system substrate-binding protein [Paenibacillus eucommiae]